MIQNVFKSTRISSIMISFEFLKFNIRKWSQSYLSIMCLIKKRNGRMNRGKQIYPKSQENMWRFSTWKTKKKKNTVLFFCFFIQRKRLSFIWQYWSAYLHFNWIKNSVYVNMYASPSVDIQISIQTIKRLLRIQSWYIYNLLDLTL